MIKGAHKKGNSVKMDKRKNLDKFKEYTLEVAESIDIVQKKIKKEIKNHKYIDSSDYPSGELKAELTKSVKNSTGIKDFSETELTVPPSHVSGDFALELFDIARKAGEKPNILAEKIANYINEHEMRLIEDALVVGAFVNVGTRRKILYQNILAKIIELGERYGESNVNAGKVVLIDFSAPNIAKPIGIGHLRSTIIGQVLSNIYHETGYNTIKDNHVGDWGTQFGSLIYAYKEWGDEEKIAKNPTRELKNLYVKFHQISKDCPEIKDKARELFVRLEQKDQELIVLWKRFRDLSLKDFERVYKLLGIEFDTNIGESYFADRTNEIVEECLVKNFCKEDKASGAVIVDQIEGLPSFLLRKQDGSSLYLSRDLATLQFRVNTFNPNVILYVVGSEQDLNFKQLFEFSKSAGYLPSTTEAKHIGFGMILYEGKKMSTRSGTLIELDDLIDKAIDKSKKIILEKNSNLSDAEIKEIAQIVGIGAIIYNDLRQSRVANISFDWDKMLNFEGGSSAYLQYTYVRIQSILCKIQDNVNNKITKHLLNNADIIFTKDSEFSLAKKLMLFPEIIVKSQKLDSPHLICSYLEELAQLFNSFYGDVSIIKTEEQNLKESRILLIKSVALVIKNGLSLLNIKIPEKM